MIRVNIKYYTGNGVCEKLFIELVLMENKHTSAATYPQTTAELVKKDLPRCARQAQM